MRNKYRLTFKKTGAVCFLGHLDLMRVFQGAVKRASVPIAYSGGFNPHQIMSFALPLPLGMEGLCEYIDIELAVVIDTDEIINKLNAALPEGIEVITAAPISENEKSAAALIINAVFDIYAPYNAELASKLDGIISDIMQKDEILITKRTKSGMKESDIRKDIFEINNKSENDNIHLEMLLAAGSMNNLKPDVVTEYIYNIAGVDFAPFNVRYVRKKQLLQVF